MIGTLNYHKDNFCVKLDRMPLHSLDQITAQFTNKECLENAEKYADEIGLFLYDYEGEYSENSPSIIDVCCAPSKEIFNYFSKCSLVKTPLKEDQILLPIYKENRWKLNKDDLEEYIISVFSSKYSMNIFVRKKKMISLIHKISKSEEGYFYLRFLDNELQNQDNSVKVYQK